MARIIKNNKAYDSGDVVVTLLGSAFREVEEISYSTEQEHQLNHGIARTAQSWSSGKIVDKATITIPMHEIIAIEDAAKAAGGDLLAIKPFDVNVTYLNGYNKIVNDTIICKFQSTGREVTGDMGLSFQYELFVLKIDYNNA